MTMFVLLAMSLVLAVLALLLKPVLWPERPPSAPSSNLVILQEQLRQLQAEQASGQLSAQEFELARLELARRTLLEQAPSEEAGSVSLAARRDARSTASAGPARRSAWLLACAVPLAALALYAQLGTPEALAPGATQALGANGAAEVSPAQVEAMIATMSAQLERQPPGQGDPAGWEMLARTLAALQRFEEADRAYARAIALAPRNAQLLTDRADVLMLLQGRGALQKADAATKEPQQLIAQALALEPNNLKALALAGSQAFEAQEFQRALQLWGRARELAAPGSAFAQGLDESLAAARSSLPAQRAGTSLGLSEGSGAGVGSGSGLAAAPAVAAKPAVAASAKVSGTVRLAPALQARLQPQDTLYIFARVAGGPEGNAPRMPVAILRLQAKALPLNFVLDDSLAMSPDFKLSGQKAVLLQARVSRSGQAMPQSGDLIGQTGPVQVGAAGVALLIDAVQP